MAGSDKKLKVLKITQENKEELFRDLERRNPAGSETVTAAVNEIIEKVRRQGDKALAEYTKRFDGYSLSAETMTVTEEEIEEAYRQTDPAFIETLRKAKENIRSFHEKQLRYSWFDTTPGGSILGQKITPLHRAGVYVPGGKAAYPSTVLMDVIPAKTAGVDEIIMTTPPGRTGKVNPGTLVAAREAGVDRIYKVGGAQAVAAMAFGTETIPRVDKIVGPGNVYVAAAKKAVFGRVGIDSVAGPTEILVLADECANPRYVAADLLSQAEHDEMACAVLVTDSRSLADEVLRLTQEMTAGLERREIIEKCLNNYGYILLADSLDEAVDIANEIAPEHMEIMTKDPFCVMPRIRNAGAVFIGEYSSEPLGDYMAGPNHVLPTNGTARFSSPLSVDDFLRKSSIIYYTEDELRALQPDIVRFAQNEGLSAHANSINVRFE